MKVPKTIYGFSFRLLMFAVLLNASCQLEAQNLIRNGSFEDIECPDNTIGSLEETENWKATGADVYYMNGICPKDPDDIQGIVAINTGIVPYAGSGYISLEGLIFKNGFCLSEGISQRLDQPIKSGSFYYLELGTLKYKFVNTFETINDECYSIPNRGLELRLDNQHIEFDYDAKIDNSQSLICDYSTGSELILNDINVDEISSSSTVWDKYWACFEAKSNFEYLSITGPNKFLELNDCMEEGLPGFLFFTGFGIDNIQLYEIPTELDTTIFICRENTVFAVQDLIKGPFLDKASFEWNDGGTGSERSFSEAGEYILNMILPCTSIPITVNVIDENCDVMVHVANVFSIHENSPNNKIKPIMVSDFIIEDYLWNIHDRWGNLVFSSRDKNEYWYGLGPNLESGVYVWKLQYAINGGLVREEVIGSITLLK